MCTDLVVNLHRAGALQNNRGTSAHPHAAVSQRWAAPLASLSWPVTDERQRPSRQQALARSKAETEADSHYSRSYLQEAQTFSGRNQSLTEQPL
eukprot:SAG31_NODE_3140_length_4629_cov_2.504636_4_plen_94_part_00